MRAKIEVAERSYGLRNEGSAELFTYSNADRVRTVPLNKTA
jgi:hypothetical protein